MSEAAMRVAVLADIHGNLPALEAVLRDVEAAGVDAIVLNGDLADGPMPAQTLDRLEELGSRAMWVRGNTDRCLAAAFDGTFEPSGLPTNPPDAYFTWCAAKIGQAHRDRLAGLPLSSTWWSGTPTCLSTGLPTPGASSTQARWAWDTGTPGPPGHYWART